MPRIKFSKKDQPAITDHRADAKYSQTVQRITVLEHDLPALEARAKSLQLPVDAAEAVLTAVENKVIIDRAGSDDLAAAQDAHNEARRQRALAAAAAEDARAELDDLRRRLPDLRQKAKANAAKALRAEYRARLNSVRDALMAAIQADAQLSDLIVSVAAQFPGGARGGPDADGYARGLGFITPLRGARFVPQHGTEEFTIESETALFLNDIEAAIASLDRQEQGQA